MLREIRMDGVTFLQRLESFQLAFFVWRVADRNLDSFIGKSDSNHLANTSTGACHNGFFTL